MKIPFPTAGLSLLGHPRAADGSAGHGSGASSEAGTGTGEIVPATRVEWGDLRQDQRAAVGYYRHNPDLHALRGCGDLDPNHPDCTELCRRLADLRMGEWHRYLIMQIYAWRAAEMGILYDPDEQWEQMRHWQAILHLQREAMGCEYLAATWGCNCP